MPSGHGAGCNPLWKHRNGDTSLFLASSLCRVSPTPHHLALGLQHRHWRHLGRWPLCQPCQPAAAHLHASCGAETLSAAGSEELRTAGPESLIHKRAGYLLPAASAFRAAQPQKMASLPQVARKPTGHPAEREFLPDKIQFISYSVRFSLFLLTNKSS